MILVDIWLILNAILFVIAAITFMSRHMKKIDVFPEIYKTFTEQTIPTKILNYTLFLPSTLIGIVFLEHLLFRKEYKLFLEKKEKKKGENVNVTE